MSARLASFRGPSTPSSSPVKQAQSPNTKSTQAAARQAESTYHRKVRASLQELRAACHTWDDLVCKDGLRSIRELIDARTDLECVRLVDRTSTSSSISGPFRTMGGLTPRVFCLAICSHSCPKESSRALASSVQSSRTWTSALQRSTWSYQSSSVVLPYSPPDRVCHLNV
jgi:hypothetical protein